MTQKRKQTTKTMRKHNRTKHVGKVATNYDHSIDQNVAVKLVDADAFATYSGWDFNAQVWIEDEHFHAKVCHYREHVATYSALSLKALMVAVSDDWGHE